MYRHLIILAILGLAAGCSHCREGMSQAAQVDEDRYFRIAADALDRRDMSYDGRAWDVSVEADMATVTFHPPPNSRGGEFIVVINRTSGAIVDMVFWR